ncbi:restriction endonuclease subunit S [Imbroritus primus]|uniref:Restriction endonuclease subunit S n=1 Tax=Imbroritus primus TaxID=3058603 RepID=A0ACD3SN53_9BURK|nr:restriction endonuclease subunit S [Burkholderiaceae bacterium PBA]
MTVESWVTESVANCLVPVSVAGKTKIQSRDYKPSGRFPVIDQGQEQIAGWTDDESAVIEMPLPLVVFGDHTRAFKFLDAPFARGADGTQLLRPKPGIDPLFFFYACRAIDLPARGYNRHFTILKEKALSYPTGDDEQKTIAAVLRQTEWALTQQSALLETLQETKRAAMARLFTHGLRGEAQKETEIGLVPESWSVERLDNRAQVVSTRMPYTELESAVDEQVNAVRVVGIKVSDMNRAGNETVIAEAALEKHLDAKVATYRCAPPGTIVFPKRGAAIATNKKRLTESWSVFDPNVIGVVPGSTINARFLFHWFQSFDLRTITEPGPTPQLNKKHLDPLPIPVPPTTDEQEEIVAILDALDRKIALHRQKRAVLEELFQSLLHKLMTGEIAVSDLDLSALSPASTKHAEVTA